MLNLKYVNPNSLLGIMKADWPNKMDLLPMDDADNMAKPGTS